MNQEKGERGVKVLYLPSGILRIENNSWSLPNMPIDIDVDVGVICKEEVIGAKKEIRSVLALEK